MLSGSCVINFNKIGDLEQLSINVIYGFLLCDSMIFHYLGWWVGAGRVAPCRKNDRGSAEHSTLNVRRRAPNENDPRGGRERGCRSVSGFGGKPLTFDGERCGSEGGGDAGADERSEDAADRGLNGERSDGSVVCEAGRPQRAPHSTRRDQSEARRKPEGRGGVAPSPHARPRSASR